MDVYICGKMRMYFLEFRRLFCFHVALKGCREDNAIQFVKMYLSGAGLRFIKFQKHTQLKKKSLTIAMLITQRPHTTCL